MSLFSLVLRPIAGFLLGDRPFTFRRWFPGLFRFIVLVELPFLLILTDLWVGWTGPFSALVLQMALVYFLALSGAFVAGVMYLKDIYDLDSHRLPLWHLASSFFGIGVPKIDVANRFKDAAGKTMVEKIGGPANLKITPGYAVLTETLAAPGEPYGPGRRFVSRGERVQEFVDLHEQEGTINSITAVTRDGIEVTVDNVKFLYRLWDTQWASDTTSPKRDVNPYPYSKNAIFDYVYSRTVGVDDSGHQKPFSWLQAVGGKVKGIIAGYISEHKLDDVIASREHEEEKGPRVLIRKRAYENDFKKGMRAMGTILRWWDPGEFRSLKHIEEQFLSNWRVDIQSHIDLNQAHGEAQTQAYEELGRAEAEAELLMSIINSLQGIRLAPDTPHNLENLILMRTAQVIRALNTPAPNGHSKDSDDTDKKKQTER